MRQIRLFEAVGRLGSVTAAAAACGLSQPAATHSLAALQRQIGLTLVNSGTRGTSLTAIGGVLHERFSLVLRKLEQGLEEFGVADIQDAVSHLTHAQLRLLATMLERGSVENATAALGLARRTAQRTARQLRELGETALFERVGNGAVLTEQGRRLAGQIGLLSDEIGWIIAAACHDEDRARQTIALGVAPDPGTAALSQAVKDLMARWPKACVELCEAGQNDLLARLAIGEVDLVVGNVTTEWNAQIEWEVLATNGYSVVARHGHPLARRRTVATADLAGYPWLLGARGSQRRAASDALLAGSVQPHCSLVTSAPPLMAQVLVTGDHLCLMTDKELQQRAATLAGLRYKGELGAATIGWARRRDWRPSVAHLDLIDLIKAGLAGMSGRPPG